MAAARGDGLCVSGEESCRLRGIRQDDCVGLSSVDAHYTCLGSESRHECLLL